MLSVWGLYLLVFVSLGDQGLGSLGAHIYVMQDIRGVDLHIFFKSQREKYWDRRLLE